MVFNRLGSDWTLLTSHMAEVGYSRDYVLRTCWFVVRVLSMADDLGDWDDVLGVVDGPVSEGRKPYLRPTYVVCRQFDEEGILPRTPGSRRHERTGARDTLCAGFAEVLDAYESAPHGRKRPGTVRGELSDAACFLSRLEGLGRTRPEDVTEEDVISVMTGPDGLPARGSSNAKKIKAVLAGSGVEGCDRIASLVPVPRGWRKVQPSLTAGQSAAVATALADPSSGLTQRDRAIGCLLHYTGMRAGDVAALTLGSVDWDRDLIDITQQKTGAPLRLPLLPQVGNAIFDYVTGERGASRDPHVFLSDEWPHGGIDASSVYNVARLVLAAAGVDAPGGSHAFRRAVATSMLGSGVDPQVASAALGHQSPRTTERYMVASVEGLRRCSIDVSRYGRTGGGGA